MGALCLSLQRVYGNDWLLLAELLTYMDVFQFKMYQDSDNVSRLKFYMSKNPIKI